MKPYRLIAKSWPILLVPVLAILGGCQAVVLSPSGDVALQQRNLLLASTALMLLIVVPVLVLIVLVAWHYRASNKSATYDPEWSHSLALEVAIWTGPLLIVIAIGALTWLGTHLLDPYRTLRQPVISAAKAAGQPLQVQVVALDWKWLFIYPEFGVASVNELAAPVDRPLSFNLTSTSVMNSFYVPALAGQIYTMPGMDTKLHAIINKAGKYEGFSANYSGAGFSRMRFAFVGQSDDDFKTWIAKAKSANAPLDRSTYASVEKPSEADPVRYFSSVEDGLYNAILNMCTAPGKMCMSDMMDIDAKGGGGKESHENLDKLRYDRDRTGAMAPAAGASEHSNHSSMDHSGMDHSGMSGTGEPAAAQHH